MLLSDVASVLATPGRRLFSLSSFPAPFDLRSAPAVRRPPRPRRIGPAGRRPLPAGREALDGTTLLDPYPSPGAPCSCGPPPTRAELDRSPPDHQERLTPPPPTTFLKAGTMPAAAWSCGRTPPCFACHASIVTIAEALRSDWHDAWLDGPCPFR